jgi:hypothetical protein
MISQLADHFSEQTDSGEAIFDREQKKPAIVIVLTGAGD